MRWCHPFLRDAVGIRCLGGAQQTVVSWSSFPGELIVFSHICREKLLESDCVLPEWGIALSLKSVSYWPAWTNAHFPASLGKTQALTPFLPPRSSISLPILASISDYVWVSTDQRQQAILWELCAIPRAEKWRNMDFRHLVWWRLKTEDKRNAWLRRMGLLRKNKEQMTSM